MVRVGFKVCGSILFYIEHNLVFIGTTNSHSMPVLTEPAEVAKLELRVQELFVEQALQQHKTIVCHIDPREYDALRANGRLYHDPEAFHLLVDRAGNILDMKPVIYATLDTPEGLQYSKLMLSEEGRRPSEHHAARPNSVSYS